MRSGRSTADDRPPPTRRSGSSHAAKGVVYTPDWLAGLMSRLSRHFERQCQCGMPELSAAGQVECVSADSQQNRQWLDLGCGDGQFLLAWAQSGDRPVSATETAPESIARRWHLIRGHLFGVDCDPAAVDAARERLRHWIDPQRSASSAMQHEIAAGLAEQIVCADALTDPVFPAICGQGGFTGIVSNPPYVREKDSRARLDRLSETELGRKWRRPRMDLWHYFVHRGLDLLQPDGRLCLIVPAYWTTSLSAQPLRDRLAAECDWQWLLWLRSLPVFPGVQGQHLVGELQKRSTSSSQSAPQNTEPLPDAEPLPHAESESTCAVWQPADDLPAEQLLIRLQEWSERLSQTDDLGPDPHGIDRGIDKVAGWVGCRVPSAALYQQGQLIAPEGKQFPGNGSTADDKLRVRTTAATTATSGPIATVARSLSERTTRPGTDRPPTSRSEVTGWSATDPDQPSAMGPQRLDSVAEVRQGIAENPPVLSPRHVEFLGERGIVATAGQGVFVLTADEMARAELSDQERQLFRPYYPACQIGRYAMAAAPERWLLYSTRDTVPDLAACPQLARHLAPFRPVLEQRREVQRGRIAWWHLHWPREVRLFVDPRILSVQMGRIPQFCYAEQPTFVGFSVNLVRLKQAVDSSTAVGSNIENKWTLPALCGWLNSSLLAEWFARHAKRRGVGLEINGHLLRSVPLPVLSADAVQSLDRAVRRRMELAAVSAENWPKRAGESAVTQSFSAVETAIQEVERSISLILKNETEMA